METFARIITVLFLGFLLGGLLEWSGVNLNSGPALCLAIIAGALGAMWIIDNMECRQ